MNFLFALFFGAGVATFAYTKLGRRVGYGNNKEVFTVTAITFVMATIVFFTLFATFVPK